MKALAIGYALVFAASVFLPPSDRFGYFMGVIALSILLVIEELNGARR